MRRADEGVSEVLGSVLLIGLTVVVLAGFGLVVLSTLSEGTDAAPVGTFALEPQNGATVIDVAFVSGTPFGIDEAAVILQVNGELRTGAYTVTSAATDGRFHPGDTLHIPLSTGTLATDDKLLLLLSHKESGKSIGLARATVLSILTLPEYATNAPSFASSALSPSPLTADGTSLSNLSVTVASTHGLALVASVTADLSSIGGRPDAVLLDDGLAGDLVAGDGVYTLAITASNHTFAASHLAEDASVTISVRDVLGHLATTSAVISLLPPEPAKVLEGASYGPIPSSAQLGWLDLTGFTFRSESALPSDQAIVRVTDSTTGIAWEAIVSFTDTCNGGPGVTQVEMLRDGVAGSAIWTPAGGCFEIDANAQLDFANLDASLDASGATLDWTPTSTTFDYEDAGISGDNVVTITFFGDTVSLSPAATGLGSADLNWGPRSVTLPGPPDSATATVGNSTVSLSWLAPLTGGSSPITGYNIYLNGSLLANVGAGTFAYDALGLQNGATYSFTIRAVTADGVGTSTPALVRVPRTLPYPPADLAAAAGNAQATLTWTPGFHGGSALTGYVIYLNNSTTLATTSSGANTSFVVNGLANGVTYTFSIAATNVVGESAMSNLAFVVPTLGATPPGIPQTLAVTNATGAGILRVTWAAPTSDGGSPITGYDLWRSTDGSAYTLLASQPGLAYDDTGLGAGTLRYYKVAAVNSLGVGANATAVSATTWNVPSAPTGLALTAQVQSVLVAWAAPANDGGAAVTGYNLYMGTSSGGETLLAMIGTNLSFTANSLTPETTYYFQVAAINAAGTGALASELSTVVLGHTYASTTMTDLNGGTVANAANLARDNGGDVATLTEVGSGSSLLVPLTQNERDFNSSTGSWTSYGVTAGKGLATSYSASGGNPGGALVATQSGTGNALGNVDYVFTPAAAAVSTISVNFDYKFSGNCGANRYLNVYIVAPNNVTVTPIGTTQSSCLANTWTSFSGTVAASALPDTTANYRIRLGVNQQGAGNTFTLDDVYVGYTGGNYRFGKELTVSGIPTGGSYTLEVRARTLANAENLQVQTSAGALLATVSSGTMTTYQITVTPTAGTYVLRLVDASASGDGLESTWEIDHVRVVSHP